ncbi:hypothetical protein AAG570_010838 [Ranatra chinensis]|uniref:Uncharacterized protein n=1 Tax=Ranatra chinensis TaxID=642074 RepID=A0ABD0YIW7_9HEMI
MRTTNALSAAARVPRGLSLCTNLHAPLRPPSWPARVPCLPRARGEVAATGPSPLPYLRRGAEGRYPRHSSTPPPSGIAIIYVAKPPFLRGGRLASRGTAWLRKT